MINSGESESAADPAPPRQETTPGIEAPLQGRVALVTGSARNIGRAIADRLGAAGASVVIVDIDAAAADAAADHLTSLGIPSLAIAADLTATEGIDSAFAQAEDRFGVVDVLVNNAYARIDENCFGPFLTIDPNNWERFFAANTTMFFGACQRFARALAHAEQTGSIVNISSHGAARAHREHVPYDSVKGAMESFTRAAAVDLAPWGIRVNAVRPGSILVTDEAVDWGTGGRQDTQIPLGRQGNPFDVANSVLYLAGPASAYVTGQIFNVDGGLAAQARAPQVEPHAPAGPTTLTEIPATLRP
ncbi:oxidoreductase [Brevibacterium sediminis]|uniref:Oxidoreductase n=1 Tax=Brevibacterium sediminis TaxID=1857024 RepID=A0ABQ1MFT2_9MICO|nr:SDR family oxidoreductase [Brevibacterium sediminis]GGC36691.1 oxidoreductase [Brevibacterium sediminis]